MSVEWAEDGLGELVRANGPWTKDHAPTDAEFIEFGVLSLPYREGLKARVELDQNTRKVGAVGVNIAGCDLQIKVLTSLPGRDKWSEIRRDITAKVLKARGESVAVEGSYGPELIVTLVGRDSAGVPAEVLFRSIGIERDNWLIHATAIGPKVTSAEVTDRIDAFLSNCAVYRQDDDIKPGLVLTLDYPRGGVAVSEIIESQQGVNDAVPAE